MEIAEQSFLKDVKNHKMTVIRDDGVNRHVRFQKPKSSDMFFDLITWPQCLCYTGDMGTFVFRRTEDMFAFFRRPASDGLVINPDYWAEKIEAADRCDGLKQYSKEKVIENFKEWLDDHDATPELRKAVEDDILSAVDDGPQAVHDAFTDFEHDGKNPFQDFWEVSMEVFTGRFIWACYAIAWGVQQYDQANGKQATSGNLLPVVAGRGMVMTIADHERAALVCIQTEMAKLNSDNALIMVLAEAVRMGREYVDAMQNKGAILLPEEAQAIMDAHEITALLANEEETDLLERNNPELVDAYCALHRIAVGANAVSQGGNDCAAEDERKG